MGFEPLDKFKSSRAERRQPTLTVWGKGCAAINKACYSGLEKPDSIDVEVDTKNKVIRLKTGSLLKKKLYGRIGHSLSFPTSLASEIIGAGEGKKVIDLMSGEDGWLYGSYSAKEGE